MEKMNLERLEVGAILLDKLEELSKGLDPNREDLYDTIEYMEWIRGKMLNTFASTNQTEILPHIKKMTEIINYVRDLQNKKDVTSM